MFALKLTISGEKEPLGVIEDIHEASFKLSTDIKYKYIIQDSSMNESVSLFPNNIHLDNVSCREHAFDPNEDCTCVRFQSAEDGGICNHLVIISDDLDYKLELLRHVNKHKEN